MFMDAIITRSPHSCNSVKMWVWRILTANRWRDDLIGFGQHGRQVWVVRGDVPDVDSKGGNLWAVPRRHVLGRGYEGRHATGWPGWQGRP